MSPRGEEKEVPQAASVLLASRENIEELKCVWSPAKREKWHFARIATLTVTKSNIIHQQQKHDFLSISNHQMPYSIGS
jgi:hypothetical protein